jgi:hypothetical protein
MRILTASAVALLLAAGSSAALAKAHNNGFGSGDAGRATSGGVISEMQSNPTPGDNRNNYGQSDATLEAKDGSHGNSGAAQTKNEAHPSSK